MEVEFVGKNGQRRKLEVRPMQDPEVVAHKLMNIFSPSQMIMGRQKLKKSFQYEVKWRGMSNKQSLKFFMAVEFLPMPSVVRL